jgi:hypothetical protein
VVKRSKSRRKSISSFRFWRALLLRLLVIDFFIFGAEIPKIINNLHINIILNNYK